MRETSRAAGDSASPPHPADIVRALVDAINRQDWTAVETLVDPAFVRHSDAAGEPGVRSCADLVRFLQQELIAFPDAHEAIEAMICEGELVAVRHRFTGTQSGPLGPWPPSHRQANARYLAMYRIVDGRVRESWAEWDSLSMLRQLGHIV
jgi:predicted ester cyclase